MSITTRINLWFDVVERIEKESHCARNQIGAILLDRDLEHLIAFGYNGNFRGGPNGCDRTDVGNCGCIHAEANALVKPRSESPYSIFVSETPCINCAKLIVNAGIQQVFALRRYRNPEESILLFKRIGILYTEKTWYTSSLKSLGTT